MNDDIKTEALLPVTDTWHLTALELQGIMPSKQEIKNGRVYFYYPREKATKVIFEF